MVEKDRPVSQTTDLKRSQSDVLEGSAESLTNFQKEGPQEVVVNETPGLNSENEKDKFNTLCEGVQTAHSTFDLYLTELLTIKDELLKHSLPSNLLINLTLTCSKLYRSASDLRAPTSELIRLVRLYSAQWEAKSSIFQKIHDDYESKQRRLDIALKKLELVGVASERVEKEKRIRNWEKVFSKVMSAKSHGHRWKFLIGSLKKKAKTGEILSIPYPSSSATDGVQNESKEEPIIPRHHRRNVRSLRHQTLLRREAHFDESSKTNDDLHELPQSREESEVSSEDDAQTLLGMKRVNRKHGMMPDPVASRFKSKYPFEKESGPPEFSRRFRPARVESPTGVRNLTNSRNPANRRFLKKNVSFVDELPEENKSKTCTKEDKNVGTGETDYERFLHVRIYKPECKLVSEPKCTICLGEQVFNSRVYNNDENLTTASEDNRYQEFVFTLPPDNVYVQGQGITNIESLQLRIAVQGEGGGQIVAMSTMGYDELKISQSDIDSEQETPKRYPMLSLVSDKETLFNSVVGHVPVICYQTKKERLRSFDATSQTLSITELIDEAMAAKKKEEETQESINEMDADEEKKIYTEDDFEEMRSRHIEEIQDLRDEYELQLQEIARISMRGSPDGFSTTSAEPKFLNACTSPIPQSALSSTIQCSRKSTPRPRTADGRTTKSPKSMKKIKTGHVLPEWGKNLPENFFDRLEQFSRASAKHHQDLSEKTKKEVQENYELKMATQNRLSVEEDELDLNDVCLPALFMPSRMGTVYSPKASLYFHPSGVSRGRFTQAPSVFKLPSSVERNSSSVMNLFDISQNFITHGPTWLSNGSRPQSARIAGTKEEKILKLS
ncbi:uncharacterized protein LOC114517064 isoform X2 [Dendronephthya gigantea]|uniref:uncharacterized protein LOC114517064 isoform X2 n=1 Tax=Dendronephthya gigantea TaxID=151771 RepID=UPI00106B5D0B|nr:uncharacterized protein LOC114517064 isoform X2 [Dendronephthya gigantea]